MVEEAANALLAISPVLGQGMCHHQADEALQHVMATLSSDAKLAADNTVASSVVIEDILALLEDERLVEVRSRVQRLFGCVHACAFSWRNGAESLQSCIYFPPYPWPALFVL